MKLRNRHWKERFNPEAEFVMNKALTWEGKPLAVGDPIPEALMVNGNRLRRYWEAGVIRLAGFKAPDVLTGQVPEAGSLSGDSVGEGGASGDGEVGGWRSLPHPEKVALARKLGYNGRIPSKDVVDDFLAKAHSEAV